jgi:hypothetical protein
MLRPTLIVSTVAILLAVQSPSTAQVSPLASVMREKIDNAQGLLRPLVLGEVQGIALYADRLGRLTYTEVASWQARPQADYIRQAEAFVKAVQDIREASRVRDVKRASRAYAELVSSCVSCHELVRGGRTVSLTPPPPVIPPPTGSPN